MVIFAFATILLVAALYALLQAFWLVPVDLGIGWLTSGFVALAGAGVTAAIGMLSRDIRALARLGAAALPPAGETEISEPQPPVANDMASLGTVAAGVAAAGVAAGAATSVLAGSAAASTTERHDRDETLPLFPEIGATTPPLDDRLLDDLERDIFADLPPAAPVAMHPEAIQTKPEPDDAPGLTDDLISPPSPEISSSAETQVSLADAEPSASDIPVPVEAKPVSPPEPADDTDDGAISDLMPAGILPDADAAAVSTSEPALAPIDTLDIVGAYDSGGTRFTMYSDGSVTAIGPTMDRRFPSLDALRAFIDAGEKS